MAASLSGGGGGVIRSGSTTVENEPIVKSDGAGEVMQWIPSDGVVADGITINEAVLGYPLRLGIGTIAPQRTIQVHNPNGAGSYISITDNTTGAASSDGLLAGCSGTNAYLWNYEAGSLELATSGVARLTIASGGAVSIPATGSFTIGSLDIGHGLGAAPTNTAVGQDALDASHAGSVHNTAIGHSALTALNADAGDNNTAVGSQAGLAITNGTQNTAVGSYCLGTVDGDYNTGVGYFALNADCVGHNVAVGKEALKVFTGSNATAVGSGAAVAATSATFLTAVGKGALTACDTGLSNTSVGYASLASVTGGDHNVAVGSYAGNTLAGAGARNTFIGTTAGQFTTSTDDCIAIGRGALSGIGVIGNYNADDASNTKQADVTGNKNIAVGNYCLDACTSGTSNVAIGQDALTALLGSSYNVAAGTSAGSACVGNNNVFAGHQAARYATSVDHCVAIGRGALAGDGTTAPDANYNIAIGGYSLDAATTATENVAIGYGSLGELTDHSYNTAVGTSAAGYTIGAYNVVVGRQAAYYAGNVDHCVAIGHEALKGPAGATATCTLVGIGDASVTCTDDGNTIDAGFYVTGTGVPAGTTVLSITTGSFASGNVTAFELSAVATANGAQTLTFYKNSGDYNIAIGSYALDATTTGNQNIAIGHNAGTAITDNTNNIAIGYRALFSANTGELSNIAIGTDALYAETSGADGCVAIGHNALAAQNTDLSNNVAIGYQAATNLNGGTDSVYVGYKAGSVGAIEGDFNTVVGTNAALNATDMSTSVFIGYNAGGTGVVQGANNICIGTLAGNDLTTGASNILIGRDAGTNSKLDTDNIVIGKNAMDADVADAGYSRTHNIAIGTDALGGDTAGCDYCVAIGSSALILQNADVKNTAIGGLAGDAIVAGYSNTLLGYSAGSSIVGGLKNTVIGHNAYVLGTANNNTVIGYAAGASTVDGTPTAAMSGADNVLLGASAGYGLTDGPGNVLIGKDAGLAMTTGDYNIAIGWHAADALVGNANYNIAVGYNALGGCTATTQHSIAIGANTLGHASYHADNINLAMGYDSGAAITTGTANVMIGHQAGSAIVGNDDMTAVGYQALMSATGADNTAVGTFAAAQITTGDKNVAIGSWALFDANGDEANNVAIGYEALHGLNADAGDDNVAIGYQAGKFDPAGTDPADELEEATQSIYVGSSTRASATTGVLNEIVIGYGAIGQGDNTIMLGNSSVDSTNGLFCYDTAAASPSDSRIKKDVEASSVGLDFIEKLATVSYKKINPADYPVEIRESRWSETTCEQTVTRAVEAADEVWEDYVVQDAREATEEETRDEVHAAVAEVKELQVTQEACDEEWEETVHPAEAEETEERVTQEAREEIKGERHKHSEAEVSEDVTTVDFVKNEAGNYVRTETAETVTRTERTPLYTDHEVVNPDGTPCVTVVSAAVEAKDAVVDEDGNETEPAVEAVAEVTEPVIHKCPVMEEYVVQEACDEVCETVVTREAIEERTERRLVRGAQDEVKEEVVVVEAKAEWTEKHVTRPAEPAREEVTERRLVSAAVEAKAAVYETVTVPADDRPADIDMPHLGLIAQDVQTAMTEAGVEFPLVAETSGGMFAVKYGNLVMPLIKAVQELSARVKTLEG